MGIRNIGGAVKRLAKRGVDKLRVKLIQRVDAALGQGDWTELQRQALYTLTQLLPEPVRNAYAQPLKHAILDAPAPMSQTALDTLLATLAPLLAPTTLPEETLQRNRFALQHTFPAALGALLDDVDVYQRFTQASDAQAAIQALMKHLAEPVRTQLQQLTPSLNLGAVDTFGTAQNPLHILARLLHAVLDNPRNVLAVLICILHSPTGAHWSAASLAILSAKFAVAYAEHLVNRAAGSNAPAALRQLATAFVKVPHVPVDPIPADILAIMERKQLTLGFLVARQSYIAPAQRNMLIRGRWLLVTPQTPAPIESRTNNAMSLTSEQRARLNSAETCAYWNNATNSLVIGCRGTVSTTDLMVTDLQLASGELMRSDRWRETYRDVHAIVALLGAAAAEIQVVGHSLGGGLAGLVYNQILAQDVATAYKTLSINVFNPGCSQTEDTFARLLNGCNSEGCRHIIWRMEGDVVSSMCPYNNSNAQLTTTFEMPRSASILDKVKSAHFMDTFQGVLERNGLVTPADLASSPQQPQPQQPPLSQQPQPQPQPQPPPLVPQPQPQPQPQPPVTTMPLPPPAAANPLKNVPIPIKKRPADAAATTTAPNTALPAIETKKRLRTAAVLSKKP